MKDGSNLVAAYRYDVRNRRIEIKTYASGSLTETRQLYYSNDWQVLEERTGTTADRQYVWGTRYVDEMVCRDDATPRRLYALQDANFNVTTLVDPAGTAGQAALRFVYDPYGNATLWNNNWSSNPADPYGWLYRHQGGRLAVNTNLYSFRNRDYQADLGRWLQRDPAGYIAGVSLYLYENAEPSVNADPEGLQSTTEPSPPSTQPSGPSTTQPQPPATQPAPASQPSRPPDFIFLPDGSRRNVSKGRRDKGCGCVGGQHDSPNDFPDLLPCEPGAISIAVPKAGAAGQGTCTGQCKDNRACTVNLVYWCNDLQVWDLIGHIEDTCIDAKAPPIACDNSRMDGPDAA